MAKQDVEPVETGRLILHFRKRDAIQIGDIRLTFKDVRSSGGKIIIEAPKTTPIRRVDLGVK